MKRPDLPVGLLLFACLTCQIPWGVVVLRSSAVINILTSLLKILPVIYSACRFKIGFKNNKKTQTVLEEESERWRNPGKQMDDW